MSLGPDGFVILAQGRHIEAIFPTDTYDNLVNDFVSVITSIPARIYGRRNSKRRAEKIEQCMEQVMMQEEVVVKTGMI